MKRSYLIIVANLLLMRMAAQINLVPNPSFEQYTTCPDGGSQINYCINWLSPTTGSPDYFNACFDSSMAWTGVMDVPLNFMGYQTAQHANAYAGVFAYDSYGQMPGQSYREYLQVQLTSALIASQTYYVSFYVSLADSCKYAVDDFGAYFSAGAISRPDFDAFNYIPQVQNNQGLLLNNKSIWYKISGSFIALGGEDHITIGNFKPDSNTDTVSVSTYSGLNQDYTSAYYYVDNVCISPDSLICDSSIGIKTILPNALQIVLAREILYIPYGASECVAKIYDSQGRLLIHEKISRNGGQIDVGNLSVGVYFVLVQRDNIIQRHKIHLIKN